MSPHKGVAYRKRPRRISGYSRSSDCIGDIRQLPFRIMQKPSGFFLLQRTGIPYACAMKLLAVYSTFPSQHGDYHVMVPMVLE